MKLAHELAEAKKMLESLSNHDSSATMKTEGSAATNPEKVDVEITKS